MAWIKMRVSHTNTGLSLSLCSWVTRLHNIYPWSSWSPLPGGTVLLVLASERAGILVLALLPPSYSIMETWHAVTMTMQDADEWEGNGLANVGGVTVASVGQMQFWWAHDFRKPFSRLYFRLRFLEWFSSRGKRTQRGYDVWPSKESSCEQSAGHHVVPAQCSASSASLSAKASTPTSPRLWDCILTWLWQTTILF